MPNDSNDRVIPDRVVADENVLSRRLDDDLVLYHPTTDDVTHLDAIATQVWFGLETEVVVSELIEELADRFGADPTVVGADVHKLLLELLAAKLICPA